MRIKRYVAGAGATAVLLCAALGQALAVAILVASYVAWIFVRDYRERQARDARWRECGGQVHVLPSAPYETGVQWHTVEKEFEQG